MNSEISDSFLSRKSNTLSFMNSKSIHYIDSMESINEAHSSKLNSSQETILSKTAVETDSLKSLDSSDQEEPEEEENYRDLPNYEEIKHFEEDYTDKEFIKTISKKVSEIKTDVTYLMFKKMFFPSHRKENFTDFVRWRRLEKIMISSKKSK